MTQGSDQDRMEMAEEELQEIEEALADDLNKEEGETLSQCARRIQRERDEYYSRMAAAEHENKRLRKALEEYADPREWGLSEMPKEDESPIVMNRWSGRLLIESGARLAGGWSVAEEALEWVRSFRNPDWTKGGR